MKKSIEELRALAETSSEKFSEYREFLDSLSPEPIPGDIFLLPLTLSQPLRWAAILRHPDDSSEKFCVPVDSFMWKTVTDVAIPESPIGPLVLRCNHGIWLSDRDLLAGRRVGRLSSDQLELGQNLMRAMVTGELVESEKEAEIADHPDYEDWCDELNDAVEHVEQWKRRETQIIDLSSWRKSREVRQSTALAAATVPDPLGEIERQLDTEATLVAGADVSDGRLDIYGADSEVWLVFVGHSPPAITLLPRTGAGTSNEWQKHPGEDLWQSSSFSTEAVRAILIFDGEYHIELHLRG